MHESRFGWAELYAGNRFLAPVSEESLLDAGRAAGLCAGMTLLEFGCGPGTAGILLAEEFHLYLRSVDASAEMVDRARRCAEQSPARGRVRLFHEDACHSDPAHGPVDALLALRGFPVGGERLVHRAGALIIGRFLGRRPPIPAEIAEAFVLEDDILPHALLWRHEATPLEWERYLSAQERELREYRDRLGEREAVSPIALAADRSIHTYRAHASHVAYELSVQRRG